MTITQSQALGVLKLSSPALQEKRKEKRGPSMGKLYHGLSLTDVV